MELAGMSWQVINARHVVFTGRKMKDKKYYWHTMYPGGIKHRTPRQLMELDKSEEVHTYRRIHGGFAHLTACRESQIWRSYSY